MSGKRIPRCYRGEEKSGPDVFGDTACGQVLAETFRRIVTRLASEEVWEEQFTSGPTHRPGLDCCCTGRMNPERKQDCAKARAMGRPKFHCAAKVRPGEPSKFGASGE